MPDTEPRITVTDLTMAFGDFVVQQDLNFTINKALNLVKGLNMTPMPGDQSTIDFQPLLVASRYINCRSWMMVEKVCKG